MKRTTRILSFLALLFAIAHSATAGREPMAFAGVITKLDARHITIKGREGTDVFNIQKAGICGWPTRKKITEVFKIGDKVIAYHFGEDSSTSRVAALNIFYADEKKVRALQESQPSLRNPSRAR